MTDHRPTRIGDSWDWGMENSDWEETSYVAN